MSDELLREIHTKVTETATTLRSHGETLTTITENLQDTREKVSAIDERSKNHRREIDEIKKESKKQAGGVGAATGAGAGGLVLMLKALYETLFAGPSGS